MSRLMQFQPGNESRDFFNIVKLPLVAMLQMQTSGLKFGLYYVFVAFVTNYLLIFRIISNYLTLIPETLVSIVSIIAI